MNKTLVVLGLLACLCAGTVGAQTDAEVKVTHLEGPVWLLKGRGGAMAASIGADGVVLVDDDLQPMAPAVLAALAGITDQLPKFVINTHWHGDHSGGNEAMAREGAVLIAHDAVRQRMSTEQFTAFSQRTTPPSPHAALPVVTFSADLSLHLNGERVAVYHVPRAHTDGDSIVHFEGSQVLHMGDAYWNGHYPRIDTDTGANVQGLMAAVRKGLDLCGPGTVVIAGHGDHSGCDGLRAFLDMLATTTARVQALIDQDQGLEAIRTARPNADYDATWGTWYIKPDDYLGFLYQSLAG